MTTRQEQVSQKYLTALTVDIYCRVSGKSQEDNTSLKMQEEKCREYAASQGFEVGMVHIEVGSGYTLDRKKLKLMQDRYRQGFIQGVIIWKVSRLARKQEFINYLMVEMKVYECQIFCVHTPLNEEDDDYQLRLFLETFFAERERREIVTKLTDAKKRSIAEGNIGATGSYKPLYGYDWKKEHRGKKLTKVGFTINKRKADFVLKGFEAFDRGESYMQVVRLMNEAGDRTWYKENVKKMLQDRRYTGKGATVFFKHGKGVQFEETLIPDGTYPQIIPVDLFERVQIRLAEYRMDAPFTNKNPSLFLLRGFVSCECGRPMTCKTPTNGRSSRYVCPYHIDKGTGRKGLFSTQSISVDEEVWKFLESIAAEFPMIRDALKKHLEQDSDKEAIARANQNIAELEQEIGKLWNDLQKGIVPEGLRPSAYARIEDLQNKIASYQAVIKDEGARRETLQQERKLFTELLQWYEDIQAARESEEELSLEAKHRFFKFIGLRVILDKGEYKQPGGRSWRLEVSSSYKYLNLALACK